MVAQERPPLLDVEVPAEDLDGAYLQHVAGFYPSGAIIAVQIMGAGREQLAELIFNPAAPADVARLDRLAKMRRVPIQAAGGDAVEVHQGGMARQEIRALLDKAATHQPAALDWTTTAETFAGRR